MTKKVWAIIIAVVVVIAIGAGIYFGNSHGKKEGSMGSTNSDKMSMSMSSGHDMSSGSMSMNMDMQLPTNLPDAQDPKYKVGDKITLKAKHMDGMYNSKGTIAGAYDTKLYAVDFTPTTGGSEVKDHKWLTKIDFKNRKDSYKVGDEVTLDSDHMSGMKGAKAKIVQVVNGPAYAVNYQPTTGGSEVKNHLYLDQDEIEAR
ncbi:YdhK family protein [Lactobacillaceae bacterium L1_55_11]|nr:YdhK family protein [Lactobacillaceae bacterium L1_55_11]